MTTIAYRAGVLAADTQMSYSDTPVVVPDLKLFISGRYAVAVSGDCRYIPTIKRWFENHDCSSEHAPERMWDDTFDILAMDVEGNAYTLFGDELYILPTEFFAIGSGRLLALGAMAEGASAARAVEIAAKHDVYTGLPVRAITMDDLKKALKAK